MAQADTADERVLLRLRPAWRSFFVYYFAAGFLAVVAVRDTLNPLAPRPFPLSPPLSLLLAAAILAWVAFKCRTVEFVLTDRRVLRRSALGMNQELELARIDELKAYQTQVQRLMGTGKIVMADSHDAASRIQFFGLSEPKRLKERISRLIEQARA